jgi:hypothetical protein
MVPKNFRATESKPGNPSTLEKLTREGILKLIGMDGDGINILKNRAAELKDRKFEERRELEHELLSSELPEQVGAANWEDDGP